MACGDRPIAIVRIADGDRLVTSWAIWPTGGPANLALVDGLARLAVGAKRLGWELQVVAPESTLVELLHLVGLDDVLISG